MIKLRHARSSGVQEPKLWTKDFTILSLGSFASLAGTNALAIALGLLILDLTHSGAYYAVYLAIGNAAGIIVPFLVASHMGRWERQKVIYTLDFATAAVMLAMAGIYEAGWMIGEAVLLCCVCFRLFNKIYEVAYYSLFPQIIDKKVYSKAYSVSSIIANFAEGAELLGTLAYNFFGVTPVLLCCSGLFFVSACFETRLSKDVYAKKVTSGGLHEAIEDYKSVWRYVKNEPGMLEILCYQFFDSVRTGAFWAMVLPLFTITRYSANRFGLDGELVYSIAMSFFSTGQFWGGVLNYKVRVKENKRLALFAWTVALEILPLAVLFFFPYYVGFALLFINGCMSIWTYCVAETVIYERVPADILSKYTGCSRSFIAVGAIFGNLMAGFLNSVFPPHSLFLTTSLPTLLVLGAMLIFRRGALENLFASPKMPAQKPADRPDEG